MRKPHTKSRNGCRDCKQRKLKCDEARPACGRCVASQRHCSFLASSHSDSSPLETFTPATIGSPDPNTSTETTSGWPTARETNPRVSPATSSSTPAPLGQSTASFYEERYSLCHMELLFHFKARLSVDPLPMRSQLSSFIDLMLQESFTASYLMDEMLAFAAAHKSTLADHDTQRYRLESTRLQSRALGKFNHGNVEITEENCVVVFAFSTLLGQHALFDTFSSATELPTVLDKLTHCIQLHRFIPAVACQSTGKVKSLIQAKLNLDSTHTSAEILAASHAECDSLLQRLRNADIPQQVIHKYEKTVQILKYLFHTWNSSDSESIIACQEWLVRVSKDFVLLLGQRRPEALVILAHYGVLLHSARHYWVIGEAGNFLIRSISIHLGAYWVDWLAWPNEVLQR